MAVNSTELSAFVTVGCGLSAFCHLVSSVSLIVVCSRVRSVSAFLAIQEGFVQLVANILFAVAVVDTQNTSQCRAVSISLHYFVLVVFFLISCQAIKTLAAGHTGDAGFILALPLVGWVAPALVIGITLAAKDVAEYTDSEFCWVTRNEPIIYSFFGVIAIPLLICVTSVGIFLLRRGRVATDDVDFERWKEARNCMIQLSSYLPMAAATWILAFLHLVSRQNQPLEFCFAIANIVTGILFILLQWLHHHSTDLNGISEKFMMSPNLVLPDSHQSRRETLSQKEIQLILQASQQFSTTSQASPSVTAENVAPPNVAPQNASPPNVTHANMAHANMAHANMAHASMAHANMAHANMAHTNVAQAGEGGNPPERPKYASQSVQTSPSQSLSGRLQRRRHEWSRAPDVGWTNSRVVEPQTYTEKDLEHMYKPYQFNTLNYPAYDNDSFYA